MSGQFKFKSKQKIQGIASVLAILLWPSISQAHLVNTGLGPFYDGISHLAMSPDDLLTALALALLAGLSGARAGRNVLFLLPPVWLRGGLFGLRLAQEVSLPLFSVLSFWIFAWLFKRYGHGGRRRLSSALRYFSCCLCPDFPCFRPGRFFKEILGKDYGAGRRQLDYGHRFVDAWLDVSGNGVKISEK
jgi:hypothetical protein